MTQEQEKLTVDVRVENAEAVSAHGPQWELDVWFPWTTDRAAKAWISRSDGDPPPAKGTYRCVVAKRDRGGGQKPVWRILQFNTDPAIAKLEDVAEPYEAQPLLMGDPVDTAEGRRHKDRRSVLRSAVIFQGQATDWDTETVLGIADEFYAWVVGDDASAAALPAAAVQAVDDNDWTAFWKAVRADLGDNAEDALVAVERACGGQAPQMYARTNNLTAKQLLSHCRVEWAKT